MLLLDKPQGMTSNFALQKVRRLFGAQKAGHTGALDPLATGVLPICFGEATKFSKYLLDADKGYFTTATLGEIRNTGDSDGELVSQHEVPIVSDEVLEALLCEFRGSLNQVPSMFSALKYQGRPLYELARQGITIDRPARPITIKRLELTARREKALDLTVECSKGTYIRSLVEDIGAELGCGAHVSMLRRFKAGHFALDDTVKLKELERIAEEKTENWSELDQFIRATDCLLPEMPKVCVNNELSRSILHGQAVRIADFEKTGLCRLYVSCLNEAPENEGEQQFAGVAELDESGLLTPKRLVNFSEQD